jgi:hypothetical protein
MKFQNAKTPIRFRSISHLGNTPAVYLYPLRGGINLSNKTRIAATLPLSALRTSISVNRAVKANSDLGSISTRIFGGLPGRRPGTFAPDFSLATLFLCRSVPSFQAARKALSFASFARRVLMLTPNLIAA